MAIDSNSGSEITLAEAQKDVQTFRALYPADIKALFVGSNNVQAILGQDSCIGIRMYYGVSDNGMMNLILVGVNSDEKDMTDGVIIDRLNPCPNDCDTSSPLF